MIANYEDVTDRDAAKRTVDAAIAAFGDLHAVVNNAGIVRDRMFVSATLDEWGATMRVHLCGHFCIAQAAYSTARGGIASLTLVQMATGGGAFDVMDPANIAPTVVWLGSAESARVTGCVFELEGGEIMLDDGWREGSQVDAGARWQPSDVGGAIDQLIAARTAPRKVWGTA